MKITIDINDDLIERAKKLSGIQSESVLVENALRLFVLLKVRKN
jgi:Arc/MetJ family transcription regulator